MEVWKEIIFNPSYEISDLGNVRRLWISGAKPIKVWLAVNLYKTVTLHKDSKPTKYLVHRLLAIHFIPNPENLPLVLHNDNNKSNIKLSNLRWGTYSDNNKQAYDDGLNTGRLGTKNRRWVDSGVSRQVVQ